MAKPHILVLAGEDTFTRDEQVRGLKAEQRADPAGEHNLDELAADGLDLPRLFATCASIPFLAERRLVIVHGLLARLLGGGPREGKAAGKKAGADGPGQADALKQGLTGVPDSTTLVFVEGKLNRARAEALLPKGTARLVEFPLPQGDELPRWLEDWIKQRARAKSLALRADAIRLLVGTAVRIFDFPYDPRKDGDLGLLDAELDKLAAYVGDRPADAEDVALLATGQDESIFKLVDAVLDGRSDLAFARLGALYEQGDKPEAILPQLAAQVRRLLVVHEGLRRRLPPETLAREHEVSSYHQRRLAPRARQLSTRHLDAAYERLLDADRAIKTGAGDPETELQLAVGRVAALMRART